MTEDNEDLGPFSDAHVDASATEVSEKQLELLVFDLGEERFGIRVGDVSSVVPFRTPAPVPHAVGAILGVLQDQGRIITVVADPLGRSMAVRPNRIVVCATSRGLLGIPATGTTHLGMVATRAEAVPGEPITTKFGTIVYVDAPFVVEKCCR